MSALDNILSILNNWSKWKRITSLPEEVDALEKRIAELEARISGTPPEFVESHGALFKLKPDGTFHKAVYCPKCRNSAAKFDGVHFDCAACDWMSSFEASDLPGILDELSWERTQP